MHRRARRARVWQIAAQGADRLHWTRLAELPAIAVSAVVESEDEQFWRHHGVDGAGLVRAAWLDLRGGRFGGSTLTMQLARMRIANGKPRTSPSPTSCSTSP